METATPCRAVVLTILGIISSLCAQDLNESTINNEIRPLALGDLEGKDFKRFEGVPLPGTFEVPDVKAKADPIHNNTIVVAKDSPIAAPDSGDVEFVVDLSTLREPSPFRKIAVAAGTANSEAAARNLPMGLALLSAAYRDPSEKVANSDCPTVGLSVEQRVKIQPSQILEIVESEITSNSACACEIVKAALSASEAGPVLTGQVVEVAATAAPESMRIISQCAIATVPDALAEVQSVLAKLDPNSGDGGDGSKSAKSSKSSKSGKEPILPPKIEWPNPLDLPPLGPPLPPPPFNPPPVTDVDGGKVCEEDYKCPPKDDCFVLPGKQAWHPSPRRIGFLR